MDPKLRINVNSGNQYDFTSSSSTSAITSFTSPSIRSGAAPSTSSGASSGMTRNLDQATRMAVELSNIPWVGSASGATLVKSLNRASLTSCGLSLHSPFKTSGLIELDKDSEKLLSPLLNGNDSTCPRGLSRDILRSLSDREALAQVYGSTLDSTYFNAVFGDSTEFPASTVLEFERHLASRIGDSGRFGGVVGEVIPAPTSVFKNNRRADGGSASPLSASDGLPRPRGHDPPMLTTFDEGEDGGAMSEVRNISARLELSRSVQARLTSGQERFKSSLAKLRGLSCSAIPDQFADVKNLPVPILMELDTALRRQALLTAYA